MKTLPDSVTEPGTCLQIGFLVKGTGMALSTLLLLTGCQPNHPPSVQAGSDQTVEEGTNVTLSGGGSDNDGTVASYRWEQIAGPPVAISNKSQPSASFVAPEVDEPVALTFRLTVVDNDGAPTSDEVAITVRLPNQPPSVQAGLDQTVDEGGSVALSGSGVDNDGTVTSYRWEQTAGPSVTILNESQASASFVAPEIDGSAVLTFRLTLVDNDGGIASDEVAVTIRDYGRLAVSLSGTVRSYSADYATAGTGISGAAVTVTQYAGISRTLGVAETDANGKYRIQLRANPGRVNVNATANGFASQSAIIDLTEGSGATADLAMLPVQVVQNFQPENDAGIPLEGQTVVSVPANSLVTASGNAVTGEATAMVTVLDPSRDAAVMPGELVRWNTETGTTDEIESFGAMNVVFADAKGERLNLASGRQASISIPLAEGRRPEDAPATIPLFYWSDTRGYWIEEGEAVLREVADGRWAYTGSVGHFTTWNADSAYDSITMKGCVTDQNGKPVDNVEVTARGSDYVGDSTATTNADGRFEIQVRPDSELQLTAVADTVFSEASTVRTERTDMELPECLVVMSDQGLQDFPMQIKGSSGELQVCVRDHECEDGDKISVDVEGRNIFSGEIVNDWVCDTVEVQAGQSYAVELTALNGTGYKGACSYADANTGEIRVTGENTETQVWRHRGGAGSRARIVVGSTFPVPEMVHVEGGSFTMGCTPEQGDKWGGCDSDQFPVHRVRVSSFEIGKYEVTQELWEAVMGQNPSRFKDCLQCPVESVSWEDVQAFVRKLNERTGEQYRLPTEAEWEYAARGGQQSRGYRYAGSDNLSAVAWYNASKTHSVGQKQPNELGLYDMSGNVWELVQDCWNDDYQDAPRDGQAWESGNCNYRVLRGGSWHNYKPRYLHLAVRSAMGTAALQFGFRSGFRIARSLP